MKHRLPRLHVAMLKPTDVIPHLGKGETHWREGYSALSLASTWFEHNALPPRVRTILDSHRRFRDSELIDAILERKTDLCDSVRGESQTDLLAIVGVGSELAIVAVEGKVNESFGPLVAEWLTDNEPKRRRIRQLSSLLGVDGLDLSTLRYQLFHRTAAAVYEARRYRTSAALVLIQSFSPDRTGWGDFAAFVETIGLTARAEADVILGPKRVSSTDLYAAWLTDDAPSSVQGPNSPET